MSKKYIKPETKLLTMRTESVILSCSVTVNSTVVVEDYHDASFSNGGSEWSIGFEEPTDF